MDKTTKRSVAALERRVADARDGRLSAYKRPCGYILVPTEADERRERRRLTKRGFRRKAEQDKRGRDFLPDLSIGTFVGCANFDEYGDRFAIVDNPGRIDDMRVPISVCKGCRHYRGDRGGICLYWSKVHLDTK